MAYGGWPHNRITFGRESTAGTAVSSTVIWRGPFASIEDARTVVVVDENIGLLINAERSYTSQYLARLAMPATELTFAQAPHILEAGVETVTPSGASPYVYTYAFPTDNSVNSIKTYTIEAHNVIADADAREMSYAFVEEFTFEANAGEAWRMSANWIGRQVTATAPTALTTLQTGNDIVPAMLAKTLLYIDASGGTIGTTQKVGVLMGASMRVRTGLVPVMVGDGQLYFVSHKFTKPEVTFSLTLELEESGGVSMVNTERTAFEADGTRLFRTSCDGPTTSQSFVMDWAGKYDRIGGYTNNNGNTTVTLEGHAVYSSADTLFWSCAIENTLATLP